jgi:L-alanine-DL-glutamate epimerase-like enolase superfamily enzyme
MKLERLSIHCLRIPFVQGFQHAARDRSESDAIVVEVQAGGVSGYGEALAREYVTGESLASVVAHLRERAWPALARAELEVGSPLALLAGIEQLLGPIFAAAEPPPPRAPGEFAWVAHNSARCALELALADAWLVAHHESLAAVLPPRREHAIYSGVISSGSEERAVALARKMKLGGLDQIKIKVGDELDEQRVARVRSVLGPGCSLRLDANGAWDYETALAKLTALAAYGIDSCEEPLGRRRRAELAALSARSPIPIVVDESLVTEADADALLEQQACGGFNLRLNKLGGLLPCLRLAEKAARHGVWCQLGSHVGETSVLAAAGRHLALHLDALRFVEGSFGSLLLSQDIASPSVKFGHGGRGVGLRGVGLGAAVVPQRLATFAVQSWSSA